MVVNIVQISNVFLGSSQIQEIYVGDVPVFSEGNNVENPNVRAYIRDVDYSEDSSYLVSYVSQYRTTEIQDLSHPNPIRIAWEQYSTAVKYKVIISENNAYTNAWTYEFAPSKINCSIYNLKPSTLYYYKVLAILQDDSEVVIKTNIVTTEGKIRMLLIPGHHLGNFRDIGGWGCNNNKHIKYGRLIRGAECYRDDGGPYMEITEEGISELRDRLGITVELDFGDFSSYSPLEGHGFDIYSNQSLYGFLAYDNASAGLRSTEGRTRLHNCLEVIIEQLSLGKNIYFHCNSGADRTGTFAFIIEALCGVSDSDKSKDYELTSFWATFYKSANKYTNFFNRFRNTPVEGEYGYNTMVAYINDTFSGNSLNEKVYNMCLASISDNGLGMTSSQIDVIINNIVE